MPACPFILGKQREGLTGHPPALCKGSLLKQVPQALEVLTRTMLGNLGPVLGPAWAVAPRLLSGCMAPPKDSSQACKWGASPPPAPGVSASS